MRAIVQTAYGGPEVLQLRDDVPEPVPAADEVLVAVHATSAHADVWHVLHGEPRLLRLMGAGLRRPRQPVPGTDVAGRVVGVGADVRDFAVGDEVFGEVVRAHQWLNGGTFAELVAAPVAKLARKPANLSFVEAAAVPTSAMIALQAVRDEAKVQAGEHVLVNGAGGALGVYALQLARAFGATVTAVDHGDKAATLRDLGADAVLDYTREDVRELPAQFDAIVDVASTLELGEARRLLRAGGRYVLIGHDRYGGTGHRWLGSVPRAIGLMLASLVVPELPRPDAAALKATDRMQVLAELLGAGRIRPVVDRTFPLSEAAAALRYLTTGQACGRIVLDVRPEGS